MTATAERIPLEAIESSNLAALGYNPEKRILAVQFKNGRIFHYSDCSLELMTEFYTAQSKGSYYAKNIRGKLTGALMTGTCPDCGDAEGWAGEKCDSCGVGVYTLPERKSTDAAAG